MRDSEGGAYDGTKERSIRSCAWEQCICSVEAVLFFSTTASYLFSPLLSSRGRPHGDPEYQTRPGVATGPRTSRPRAEAPTAELTATGPTLLRWAGLPTAPGKWDFDWL